MRDKKAINSGGAAGAHTGYKRQQMTDNGGCGRTHGTIQKATNVLIVEAAGAHTGYKRQQMTDNNGGCGRTHGTIQKATNDRQWRLRAHTRDTKGNR